MTSQEQTEPPIAFYYPGHLWRSGDWIKNLLLFFDGVGLLVPAHKKAEPETVDPAIAIPLRDQGLLHILDPETLVDQSATECLVSAMVDLITSGALDTLAADGAAFQTISRSRFGYSGDVRLAEMLFEELKARSLASDSQDALAVTVHPSVRHLILILLAQILRAKGHQLGLDLSPATDQRDVVEALSELIAISAPPSSGHVIALDLQTVGVDLSAVPLDEVLDFRRMNLESHRAYVRGVRQFVRELSLMSSVDRSAALAERKSQLDDMAHDLARKASKSWRQPAAFTLGITGAAWRLASDDEVGALLAASSALAGVGGTARETGAYSYLFAAHHRYA